MFLKKLYFLLESTFIKKTVSNLVLLIIYYLIFYRAGEGFKFLRHYDCFCINVMNETSFTFSLYQNIMDGLWHHVAVTWTALDATDPAFPKGIVTLFIDNQVVAKQEDFATGMQLPPL